MLLLAWAEVRYRKEVTNDGRQLPKLDNDHESICGFIENEVMDIKSKTGGNVAAACQWGASSFATSYGLLSSSAAMPIRLPMHQSIGG